MNTRIYWEQAPPFTPQWSKEQVQPNMDGQVNIDGVGPDSSIVEGEHGGRQSDLPYRFDLFDGPALFAAAKVLKEGAEKYGENNWRFIPTDEHLNHLLAHVYAFISGDTSDEHLTHALCRAMFALAVDMSDE